MAERHRGMGRGLAAIRLVARGGARYAGNAPRLFMTAGEQRQQLRNDLALQTADYVRISTPRFEPISGPLKVDAE